MPTPITRRDFSFAAAAAVLAACSSNEGGPSAPTGVGVTVSGNTMTVPVTQNPSLQEADGMILVPSVQVLVIRAAANDYRALTSVCTHQACTVNSFSGGVLECPCHGSRFGTTGAVVRGPATSALRTFPTTFNATTGVITVNLA